MAKQKKKAEKKPDPPPMKTTIEWLRKVRHPNGSGLEGGPGFLDESIELYLPRVQDGNSTRSQLVDELRNLARLFVNTEGPELKRAVIWIGLVR